MAARAVEELGFCLFTASGAHSQNAIMVEYIRI